MGGCSDGAFLPQGLTDNAHKLPYRCVLGGVKLSQEDVYDANAWSTSYL